PASSVPPVSAAGPTASTQLLDRVVAVVNDEVITRQELDARLQLAESQLQKQRIAAPPRATLARQVLERLIIDRAQLQLARETGVRVDDATVNMQLARIAEANSMTLQSFRERLAAEGVSFNQFRDDVRNEIILARLRDREVDNRIQVSEGEIENFLAEQTGTESSTVEYNVAQIVLRLPENATAETIDKTRVRAEELMRQIRSGADFAQLAASYSAGPEALKGGELGWRTAERLPTIFFEAVKDLTPGSLAPIVRSPGGLHILKLAGKRNATDSRLAAGPVQQTRVRHILLRVSEATPESEVKRRLVDLRERVIKGGQDFGQLARLHSMDGSSTRGGELGWLYAGETVPEFERAMNALKLNEVSEPVQSPFGWHLIQVLERRTDESPFERNRLAARQALRERKADEAYRDWLRQLRDRTYVEYKLEDF
ncbi:MAG TPA: peptidylprolyl isomerase, partial [Burkholderiaceae bacterium]|nr:peptidylprolyl isomerase [Burkholderiaceae bacterium]